MPPARTSAIQAVVNAWVIPGVDPAEHAGWQVRLQQPSPEGWPALAKAVMALVTAGNGRERNTAAQAVVDAWTIPGVDPGEHAAWQERLGQHSPDGWPMLRKAVVQLVAVTQERQRGNQSR